MNELAQDYERWLASVMGDDFAPHTWQSELALQSQCRDRLIRIPTGFGKTLGVLLAWAYNRIHRGDNSWPRRLVWCLPMRVLVEQTQAEVEALLTKLGLLWDGKEPHHDKVGVHVLMGGSGAGDWHLWPEEAAVLIGTQDMLLSRALNRGYAAARARWPMEFGLLNQDALWILDEVQLMDVGLATSAQLQAFRWQEEVRAQFSSCNCRSWWMSATLQPSWLESVDTRDMLHQLPSATEIPAVQQREGLWDVTKSLECNPVGSERDIAQIANNRHQPGTLTLVVVNRVETARQVFEELEKLSTSAELRLVHSRFRPHERVRWRDDFLKKAAKLPSGGRIIVATQVIEAGVDISASALITELAPWPSLVQRFGRCARYAGEMGAVIVLDRGWTEGKDDKRAMPYILSELLISLESLHGLKDVSPRSLEVFERSLSVERRQQLYPYQPRHLLLRREWNDLFDTTPDLSGADVDIGRFIRSSDELDVQVFWRDVPNERPEDDWKPNREELCAIPFRTAQEWLCGKETKEKRAPRLREKMHAWVWDWLDGSWKRDTRRADVLPGRIVLVDASCGGYSDIKGWDPETSPAKPVATVERTTLEDRADDAQDSEDLSLAEWKTIATHGREAGIIAKDIADRLNLSDELRQLLVLAAETHDVGKSIRFFQGSMRRNGRPNRDDLAKAPKDAWNRKYLYQADSDDHEKRPGLRHELASALSLFDVLRRCAPAHPALLGECAELLGLDLTQIQSTPATGEWELRVLELQSRESFDLLVYLVASHHGKVRMSLHASPVDQDYEASPGDGRGMPIRGIREGDTLPPIYGKDRLLMLGASRLTLEPACLGLSNATGPSWSERTIELLSRHGPGTLALLEAIIRAADIRASRLNTTDPLLPKDVAL